MDNIKSFHKLFEAVDSKQADVDHEQEIQANLSAQIKILRDKIAKSDAQTNKKQFQKTQVKGQLTQNIGKLTAAIAQSIAKEGQALLALSQSQSKE